LCGSRAQETKEVIRRGSGWGCAPRGGRPGRTDWRSTDWRSTDWRSRDSRRRLGVQGRLSKEERSQGSPKEAAIHLSPQIDEREQKGIPSRQVVVFSSAGAVENFRGIEQIQRNSVIEPGRSSAIR
jgi:hypothetical protein